MLFCDCNNFSERMVAMKFEYESPALIVTETVDVCTTSPSDAPTKPQIDLPDHDW